MAGYALTLARHCPALRVRRSRRRARDEPYNLIGDLAAAVVAARDAEWVHPLLLEDVERIIASDPDAASLIGYGLLEDIQNISSHRISEGAADWLSLLGPRTRQLWLDVDELWLRVADELRDPPAMTENQFASVTTPELREFMERVHRRTAEGVYVSIADVLDYETRHDLLQRG